MMIVDCVSDVVNIGVIAAAVGSDVKVCSCGSCSWWRCGGGSADVVAWEAAFRLVTEAAGKASVVCF